MDNVGTLWISSEMVFHKAEDAVCAPFVETELVEGFGFFELAVAFIGRGSEVDAANWVSIPELLLRSSWGKSSPLGNSFGKPDEYL